MADRPQLAELGDIADLDALTPMQRRQLVKAVETGSPFEAGTRMFGDWRSGDVFDYGDPNARDVRGMLETDGTARQIEQVLSLPIRGADATLIGGSARGRKLVAEQLPAPQLDLVIAQCTSAAAYRKAFFELTWSIKGSGVHLDGVGFRPATACQAAFDQRGRPNGYRQRVHLVGGITDRAAFERMTRGEHPGYVRIPKQRSFIYTHGTHREPLTGVSDLSVAYWATETSRRVMFLILQYLEKQALPAVLAYGEDPTQATANANAIASLRGGGVAPVTKKGDAAARAFDLLESSGKGADQFITVLRLLDQWKVDSVLASFTKLAGSTQTGSYALSADQSEFFLAAEQAFADEIANQIVTGLFAPICIWNGLKPADVPRLQIGPISKKAVERALDLLKALLPAQTVRAPDEFLDMLLLVVAPTLGLDVDELRPVVDSYRRQVKADAEQQKANEQAAADAQASGSADQGGGEQPPDDQGSEDPFSEIDSTLANPAGALDLALPRSEKCKFCQERATKRLLWAEGHAYIPVCAQHEKKGRRVIEVDNSDEVVGVRDIALANDDDSAEEHTGGMVCLVPSAESARKLLVKKPGAEPLDQLHLTLAYLGDDVTGWPTDRKQAVLGAIREVYADAPRSVITARAFAHITFNPDGGPDGDRDPCAVYGIGDSEAIAPLRQSVLDEIGRARVTLPKQHEPFVPHITGGYGLTAADLDYIGPVVFDRLALVIGPHWTFLHLDTGKVTTSG